MPEKENEIIIAWKCCGPNRRREFLLWLDERQKLKSIALIIDKLREVDDTKRETS